MKNQTSPQTTDQTTDQTPDQQTDHAPDHASDETTDQGNDMIAKENGEPITSRRSPYRAGFVALIGQPNAGKSTLLNTLLGEKVSIVSPKPQTTRVRVAGILTREDAQVIFVDSPGALKSTSGLNKFLQEELEDVIEKSDVLCAVLGADDAEAPVEELLGVMQKSGKPWVAVLTKNDLLGGTRTPKFFKLLIENKIPFLSISANKRPNEARDEVLNSILPLLPEAPAPLYDEELYTTQTVRQMAAEFIREACFDHLRQEVPYGLAVKIAEFKEDQPIIRIRANLVIDKENHKAIVIGAKGQTIKAIGIQARSSIEKLVGRQVFLELHVEVRPDWTKNPRMMKELGYVIAKD